MKTHRDYVQESTDIYMEDLHGGIEFHLKNKVELAILLAITELTNEVKSVREELKSTNKEVQKPVDTPKRK